MVELLREVVTYLALMIEAVGAITIVISVATGLWPYVVAFINRRPQPDTAIIRSRLGRGLVLSLEIFIAADLLHTILQPTLQDVAVLAVITILRTILSFSLEYELRQLQKGSSDDQRQQS